jgi:hypothetical protein
MFDESPSIINVPLYDLPRERSESRVLKGRRRSQVSFLNSFVELVKLTLQDLEKNAGKNL